MLTNRQLFLQHLGQTSPEPPALEFEHAKGVFVYDKNGKKFMDLISGVSVSNVGHCHPKVLEAVKNQVDKYMHLMVYGEYILSPQVKLATKICEYLPKPLSSVFLVNSGSEANEGALKLAKRYTGRHEIIACRNAYHGSTHGAMSLMSDETFTHAFKPLLPGVEFINYNNISEINLITEKTACVITEAIQAEGGIRLATLEFMTKLRQKCTETGTLLIIDEVQTGFGRTGKLFGFENYNIVPDIITTAKGMGGGMPIGAFISSKEIMDSLSFNPILGHITTFGGHPVSAAASLACLEILFEEHLIEDVSRKGELFKKLLIHPKIKSVRGIGLLMALELSSFEEVKKTMELGFEIGFLTDWFLFCDNSIRIAPPLTITDSEIEKACELLCMAFDRL